MILSYNDCCYIIKSCNIFAYKLNVLAKYIMYARIIHSRIVNFYLNMLAYGGENSVENFCSIKTTEFADMLISLHSTLLFKYPEKYDVVNLDFNICELIQAEIRLHSCKIIYKDVIDAFTSFLSSDKTTLDWWLYDE